MCDFCKDIKEIKESDIYNKHPLKAKTNRFPQREELVLAKLRDKIIFYGFNKYFSEDDAMYEKTEVKYCPICAQKLTEV